MSLISARELALKVLMRVDKGAYAGKVLDAFLARTGLDQADRNLVTNLVYGTLKNRALLDALIERRISRPPTALPEPILHILRMGVYQIMSMTRIPRWAAVNEMVTLAKKYGHAGTAGLVNATLRHIDPTALIDRMRSEIGPGTLDWIALETSHPLWLVKRWVRQWGVEKTEQICRVNQEPAPLSIRCNTLLGSPESIEETLTQSGATLGKNTPIPEEREIVELPQSLNDFSPFAQGMFQVQDASAMMVGHLVDPKPGETVIDLCAGPGGKTTHLAALMTNRGQIIAVERHRGRLNLVQRNCERLGVNIVSLVEADALSIESLGLKQAQRVLVDAPCSGTGVLRRRAELRWRLREQGIAPLAELQLRLLHSAAKLVAPEGVLVYSTCTLEIEENEEVAEMFLRSQPNFELDPACHVWMKKYLTSEGFLRIFPGGDRMDGAFAARFRKRR